MKQIINTSELPETYLEEKCFITEILNSGNSPELSIAKARVEPGVITMLHKVKNTEEKYYILSGTGEMEIDGKITGIVSSGDLVNIPANATQRIKNTGSEDLVFLCICTPRFEAKNYEACEEQ